MQTPRIPANEEKRVHALCELQILDTASEERFDRLTRITQSHFQVPIVLVSLVDTARQWFKSRQGLDATQTPRGISFCGHAILSENVLYVPNALEDERFADNPLVTGSPNIRFYAGAPLRSQDGYRIGTLCLIDDNPRELTAAQLALLRDLADCVEHELHQVSLRQSAQTIKDHQSHLQAVLDTVVDGILTIDDKGIVQTVNPATVRMFGYSAEELQQKNVNKLMPEAYAREHDGYVHNYLETGEAKVIGIGREVIGQHKDGTEFPVDLAVSEMRHGDQRFFVGILRDTRERADSLRLIAEKNAHLQAVLDTVIDGIISIDEDRIMQAVNPAAERIFGYKAEELLGHNVKKLMPENYARDHDEYILNYMNTGEAKVIGIGREVTGRRKDGTDFPMDLAVSEMWHGEQRFFVGVVRDITERKKVEKMKNEFISMVSHELRTPLTSIRGSLSLVLGKAKSELSPKILRLLENANRNSERLTYLINDILDLEKIESGRLVFEFAPQHLNDLSRQALEANEGYARKHNVRLSFESTEEDPLVWGDEHRLSQVFANLISNAVKFSPPEGVVKVAVSAHNNEYRVAVRDRGRGIPQSFRAQIFQRFAQADSSDTREKGGTGLGLSITKAIVERHGGLIDYHSEEGKGAEFYFHLPQWHEVILSSNSSNEPAVVLICEDNTDVAFVLSTMLDREGLSCDVAATAASAKALLASGQYRLLLLDLTLPDADGLELLRDLRAQENTADLPVIVVSGRADESRSHFDGDTLRVVDWLQKPLDNSQLSAALTRAMGGKRARVLHVEDDPDILQFVGALLEETAEVEHATSLKQARQCFDEHHFDMMILDLSLPDGSGLELLEEAALKECPVLIFSGESPEHVNQQVVAALTKARTTNEQIVKTIKRILNR